MKCIGYKLNEFTLFYFLATLFWCTVSSRTILTIDSECTSCSYYTAHICVSPFLYSNQLISSIEKQISTRFASCTNKRNEELLKLTERRKTVMIAMVECSSRRNWSELAELASAKWANEVPCEFDMLIVLFHQWKLIPALAIRNNSSNTNWYQLKERTYQLSEKYGSEEAEQLLNELFSVMNVTEEPLATSAAEGVREHVPDWAFVVIIVSILLSALAFYIGTCINKRTSWRPFSSGKPKTAANRRLWGAGFSGGIWGAS